MYHVDLQVLSQVRTLECYGRGAPQLPSQPQTCPVLGLEALMVRYSGGGTAADLPRPWCSLEHQKRLLRAHLWAGPGRLRLLSAMSAGHLPCWTMWRLQQPVASGGPRPDSRMAA